MKERIKEKIASVIEVLRSGRATTSLMLVVVTFCLMVATSVAWITANRTLGSNDMNMGLSVDDTSAVYKVYMYDLINQVGTDKITVDGKEEELNLLNLHMNQYDTIFKVQNKFTPAFAQIKIIGNTAMPESGTVYLTIDRDSQIAGLENDGKLAEIISSMLRFTAIIDHTKADKDLTGADELYKYINPESRFNEIKLYKGSRPHSKTFVTSHGEGENHSHTKADSITIEVDYTADDWYTDADGHKILNVYLYISYDAQQLECFLNEHSNGLSLEEPAYNFDNDLKKVTVSYKKETD